MKEEILNKIKKAVKIKPYSEGRNSMGASESFYNKYYMVGQCFKEEELEKLDENELINLLKLADFAGEVFY